MLKKLMDYVYYFFYFEEMDWLVFGFICGEKYSFIVDVGNFFVYVLLFLEEVEKMGVFLFKGVVIMYWYWDYIFGIYVMNKYIISYYLMKKKLVYLKILCWDDDVLDKCV